MEEIVGTIVLEGVKYLLKKVVNEVGKSIWQALTDEDGDGVPDDPDNPVHEWDEEPTDWEPFPQLPVDPDDPSEPVTSDPTEYVMPSFIVITPDGPVVYAGTESDLDVIDVQYSEAAEVWNSYYGALDKPFANYSVSEAILFLLLILAVVAAFKFLFGNRRLY